MVNAIAVHERESEALLRANIPSNNKIYPLIKSGEERPIRPNNAAKRAQ